MVGEVGITVLGAVGVIVVGGLGGFGGLTYVGALMLDVFDEA